MAGRDPGRSKLRSLIARECTRSLMDDARWNKALVELRKCKARFRLKLLTDPEVSPWDSLVPDSPENYIELPKVGPVLCLEVEWLEIDPIERRRTGRLVPDRLLDHTKSVEQTLESLRLPYSREDAFLRIWGHVRKGQDPKLV